MMPDASSNEVKQSEAVESSSKHEQQRDSTSSSADEDAAIQKAIRFWNHPSLSNISTNDKIAYLRAQNVTEDQLHKAWERIAEQKDISSAPTATSTNPPQPAPPQQQQYHPSRMKSMQSYNSDFRQALPPSYPPNNYQSQHGYYHYQETDEEPQYTNAALFLTIGGMLGLGAAAAVRWLNGGDFTLMPPPSMEEKSVVVEHDQQQRYVSHEEEEESQEQIYLQDDEEIIHSTDDMIAPEDDSARYNPLLEQVQELTTVLKSHVATQERVLQKMSATHQRQVTEKAMDLLRPPPEPPATAMLQNHESSSPAPLWALYAQLVELRAQLSSTTSSGTTTTNSDQESELRVELLQQLCSCIKTIELQVRGEGNVEPDSSSPTFTRKSLSTDSSSTSSGTPVSRGTANNNNNILTQDKTVSSRPPTSLHGAIEQLALENEPNTLRSGAQILYLYTLNLSSHSTVPRYRKIYKSNETFKRVQELKGGTELLLAVGFQDSGNVLEWQGDDLTCLKEAAAALSILKSPQQEFDANALAQAATAVLSSCKDTTTLENTTPMRKSSSLDDDFASIPENDDLLQTPQTNILVSPPSTKKHTFLSSSGFPEAPLDILNESSSAHAHEETSLLDISSASLEIRPYPNEDEEQEEELFSSDSVVQEEEEEDTSSDGAEPATPMMTNASTTISSNGGESSVEPSDNLQTPRLNKELI